MKCKLFWLCFSAFLVLGSCSKEEVQPIPEDNPKEEFYMVLHMNNAFYTVSNKEYQMGGGTNIRICDYEINYVTAFDYIGLGDKEEGRYISGLMFYLSKKVFFEKLNSSDESSYMKNIIYSDHFGFPTIQSGFYYVYDLENNLFEVPKDVSAEGYLRIFTNDRERYTSSTIVPNQRDERSFLYIDKVIDNKEDTTNAYPYIVEGRFKVDLFKGDYSTESEIVEGNFRWPIAEVKTSELLELCD